MIASTQLLHSPPPQAQNTMHSNLRISSLTLLLFSTVIFSTLLCPSDTFAVETQKAERPNIVFFFTDDQTASSLACYGNPVVQTPNIDALARQVSSAALGLGRAFNQSGVALYCPFCFAFFVVCTCPEEKTKFTELLKRSVNRFEVAIISN